MEKDNNKFDLNNQRTGFLKFKGWGLFAAMFWAFFFALALSNVVSPYLSQIINGLFSGITPLLIGIVTAFIFTRFIDFIEKKLLKNVFKNSPYKFAIKRTISITASILVLFAIVSLVISILVPKIVEIVQRLTARDGAGGAEIYDDVVNQITNIIQSLFGAEVTQDSIKSILSSVFEWFLSTVGYLNNIMALSFTFLTGLFNCLIGILLTVLILKDKERISRFFRRFTYANFKKEKADELCVMTKNASNILYNYIICKLIEFVVLFVTLGITYMILGLEFTWELSLIIGLFNFIPYFGIYIGAVPVILITLIFNSINSALYVAIATFVITTIEFNIILPFITGKRLKVSALVVTGSIIIGGAMFGILGMLFAPPIAALISVIITGNIELKENRMRYLMELNEVREKNLKEQQEQLGINIGNEENKSEVAEVTNVENKRESEKPKKVVKNSKKKNVKKVVTKNITDKNNKQKVNKNTNKVKTKNKN